MFLLVGGKGKLISIGVGMIPPLVLAGAVATSSSRRNLIMPSKYNGDWNLYRGTILFVVIPLVMKIAMVALEYGLTNPKKVANHLGISTLPAIAISLIPVSRYSRILQSCGWTIPQAIHEIHVALGWYSVWAGTLHVIFYTYVWWTRHEASWRAFVPDLQCWVGTHMEDADPCLGCSCASRMHYLTGAVVALAFLAIVVTSTRYMRRSYYALFYRVHVIAAPIAVLLLYMHWRKTTMYLSGGVIVYLASWSPNYLEQIWQKRPTRIMAVDCVPCRDHRDVLVLTIASTDARFSAGQFVKLHAPGLSHVSHPFTVFAGPERDGTFHIMFRQSGTFTKALGHEITSSLRDFECDEKFSSPSIYLDGFHGGVDRLHQLLHHDHVVLVAGGIGITPMIALISQLVADDAGSNITSPLSTVTLYWICRDPTLIQYMKERFFDAWAEFDQHVNIHVVVHNTAVSCAESSDEEMSNTVNQYSVQNCAQLGIPFKPSILSNAAIPTQLRYYSFATNVLIIGLTTFAVYAFYYKVPTEHNVLKALLPPIFVVALAMIVSMGALLSRSSKSSYQAVPLTEAASGGVVLKAKSSFNNRHAIEQAGHCAWQTYLGRPSITDIKERLADARFPAAFACGPSSLIKSLSNELLESNNSCAAKVALYVEHFEM